MHVSSSQSKGEYDIILDDRLGLSQKGNLMTFEVKYRNKQGAVEYTRVDAASRSEVFTILKERGITSVIQVLDATEIIYIETEKRSCRIHTQERDYIQNESMNYYETRLKACRFFRIHKSFLVNLDYVAEMVPGYNNGYSVKMKYFEENLLPIGRTQLKEFRRLFGR